MLKLISEIIFIKNKSTVPGASLPNLKGVTGYPGITFYPQYSSPSFSTDFSIGNNSEFYISFAFNPELVNQVNYVDKEGPDVLSLAVPSYNIDDFIKQYEAGNDVALMFNWVNDIEIEKSFKKQSGKATIKFPLKLNFDGKSLIRGTVPIFGIGDRVVINLGYSDEGELNDDESRKYTFKEVFRGYITQVSMTTPMEITCEDCNYILKQIPFNFPANKDEANMNSITFDYLIKRMLSSQNKLAINNGINLDSIFDLTALGDKSKLNTVTTKNDLNLIPVYCPLVNSNIDGFTHNSGKITNCAEVFDHLKKKFGCLNTFFDDFGNLNIQLTNMDVKNINKISPFKLEQQVIDFNNMHFQRQDETAVKVIYESKRSKKGQGALYARNLLSVDSNGTPTFSTDNWIGDFNANNTITVNGPEDMTQNACNYFGQITLQANKYTGFKKGSTFETFGEPAVFLGEAVSLSSNLFPEKVGADPGTTNQNLEYAIVGVTRKFGLQGYRQIIEVGVGLGNSLNLDANTLLNIPGENH